MMITGLYSLLLISLPSYSVFLNIPLRYLLLTNSLFLKVIYKDSILFLVSAFIFSVYITFASIFSRQFNLIDVSFFLTLIFTWYILNVFYNKPLYFLNFTKFFFLFNVIYAILQNVALNVGVLNDFLLLHQNTHQDGYVIPQSFIPYLYRVTGLFNESVPYVLYLMVSYIYFLVNGNSKLKYISLVMIMTSGAKLGVLFIVLNILISYFTKIKIYKFMIMCSLLLMGVFFFYNESIVKYIFTEPVLFSIYLRGEGLFSVLNELKSDLEVLMFGAGSISSIDMMSGDMKVNRSTDIISLMLYSNGLIGTFLINIPIFYYFYKLNIDVKVVFVNKIFLVLLLMFMVSGAYTFWVYMYFVLIISTFSSKYMKTKLAGERL